MGVLVRPLVLVAIAALGGAAMCGDDSASLDGGPDATTDAPRDVSADTPRDEGNDVPDSIADSRSDAGPALWTRFPNTPEICDLEYAMAPASALDEIAWVDCPSGTASDCALLEYDAAVSRFSARMRWRFSRLRVRRPHWLSLARRRRCREGQLRGPDACRP